MQEKQELTKIRERYKRRLENNISYSLFDPFVYMTEQDKERSVFQMLKRAGFQSLSNKKILEIGGGAGNNVYMFLRLGAEPENIYFNELIKERIEGARKRLPSEVVFFQGDANYIPLNENSVDIAFQSLVFSSILDVEFKKELAGRIWKMVKPGGGLLWYDFTFDNPSNPDVKGIKKAEIRDLFPGAEIMSDKIILAPPLSRMMTKISPKLYTFFNIFPFLRTHILCWIGKK